MIRTGPEPTTDHPTLTAARSLHHILDLARVKGWPMPFVIRGWDSGRIELQFHTYDEVDVWANVLNVFLTPAPNVRATGTLLDTQVTVCAFVPEGVAS